MRIKQFAAVLGVSTDTIKRLERQGLLVPRRDWRGHRRYSAADVAQARQLLFPTVEARS